MSNRRKNKTLCWEISTRQGKNLELLPFLIERHTFTESEKRITNLIFFSNSRVHSVKNFIDEDEKISIVWYWKYFSRNRATKVDCGGAFSRFVENMQNWKIDELCRFVIKTQCEKTRNLLSLEKFRENNFDVI